MMFCLTLPRNLLVEVPEANHGIITPSIVKGGGKPWPSKSRWPWEVCCLPWERADEVTTWLSAGCQFGGVVFFSSPVLVAFKCPPSSVLRRGSLERSVCSSRPTTAFPATFGSLVASCGDMLLHDRGRTAAFHTGLQIANHNGSFSLTNRSVATEQAGNWSSSLCS